MLHEAFELNGQVDVVGPESGSALAGGHGTLDELDRFVGILEQNVEGDRRFPGVIVGQEHEIGDPLGGFAVVAFDGGSEKGFTVGEVFGITGEKVLGVEHLVQGCVTPGEALLSLFG